jgi:hypothetical protein
VDAMFVTLIHKAVSLCGDTRETGTISRLIDKIVPSNLDRVRTRINVPECVAELCVRSPRFGHSA